MSFPGGSAVKNPPSIKEILETKVWFLGLKDPMEEEMTIHSIIIAGKIPWTEEPGRLQSIGLQRVLLDWVTKHILRSDLSGVSTNAPKWWQNSALPLASPTVSMNSLILQFSSHSCPTLYPCIDFWSSFLHSFLVFRIISQLLGALLP